MEQLWASLFLNLTSAKRNSHLYDSFPSNISEKNSQVFCLFPGILYRTRRSKKGSLSEKGNMLAVLPQENVVAPPLESRTGRHLQRYNKQGGRQVVGCIPYRHKIIKKSSLDEEGGELEVLVISSQNGKRMIFPKGGWELDESITEAAVRETLEEAGVRGIIEPKLGTWSFKSKTHGTNYEGYMFPLLVQEQLDTWPEKNFRQRTWMTVAEARKVCHHLWMKEALDRFEQRLKPRQQHIKGELAQCFFS